MVVLALACAGQIACKDKIADGQVDGARIFAEACATCHGSMGKPSPSMVQKYDVADLTSTAFRERATLASIRNRVTKGSSGKGMPAFRDSLTDEQLDAIATFVMTLSQE